MIPRANIVEWSRVAPWPTPDQVEQDLLLCRLIVEIANHETLGEELTFRGGTCLHKLHLPDPIRYSEDLDYVRRSATPIGPVLDELRSLGEATGFDIQTDVGEFPKLFMSATSEAGALLRIKIEMNTRERESSRPLEQREFRVESSWFTGSASVLTFEPHELVATKVRALFQRSKGRDLFDIWLALEALGLSGEEIAACFERYRPDDYTRARAVENLETKLIDPSFVRDLESLVVEWPEGYDMVAAAERVKDEVFAHL